MLRLGLIENLQRIASRLAVARKERDLADLWVDQLQETAEKSPARLVVVVAEMAQANLPVTSAFVAEFCQSQAADQVSVSHSIGSLRFLSSMDWRDFVETLSLVDSILRSDPAEVYPQMDFATRDRYRHSVEFLARHSALSEPDVARRAIQQSEGCAAEKGAADRTAHVGFHLIDKGLPGLERVVGAHLPWRERVERAVHRWPLAFYAGGIGLITVATTVGVAREARELGLAGWSLAGFAVCLALCASQLAVAVMNWLSMLLVKPRLLPRLDYSHGIPAEQRTVVAVPTMLTTADGVDRLVETLEIHYLANRD